MGFLETARFLENSGTREADYRSAVSRSYYACYLAIGRKIFDVSQDDWKKYLRFFSCRDLEHRMVKEYLINCSIPELSHIGTDFKFLQTKRKSADYDMEVIFQKNDASDAIELAERIVSAFSGVEPVELQRAAFEFIASKSH